MKICNVLRWCFWIRVKKLTFFKSVRHSGANKFWLILFFFQHVASIARNAGIKWFKERSVKFGGKDTVLLCLRYWASLVSSCFDSITSHWNLWNDTVLPA